MKVEKPLRAGSDEETIQANIRELIAAGRTPEQAAAIAYAEARRTKKNVVPSPAFHYSGPECPRVVFVLADGESPTLEEMLRARPLVNEDAVAFEKRYLEPLGLARDRDVGVAWMGTVGIDFARGERELVRKLDELRPDAVVFLGLAASVEGAIAMPRFVRRDGVWKASFAEEARRKMKALRRNLDGRAVDGAASLRPLLKAARPHDGDGIATKNAKTVRVHKALEPKRIVYGVVLDPYVVDLQGDWIPPASIEETAHDFVAKHGYISYQHEGMADAQLVESFIEEYPTASDRERAFMGLSHRATRRKYGDDVVHSGAWVIGVKLSPQLWDEYLAGNLNAFSIEGFGTRTPMEAGEMPQVSYLEVETIG